ncbi:hypothetical protein BUE93_21400 [Chromobacterium amazonense]|uniref:Uncharacterized protein n=1 Tax=Chromobacterium amazonense TaxID=1382803 RepID=A0A2S9WYQ5_9NEIS|nr:hypothetical protein [Chromobacterium amazonense]PRP68600.1 hypothetical protein BUE93_21400 [Chromobacterium amazonense]
MQKQPFARAIAFHNRLLEIEHLPAAKRALALSELGHYESRGKGRDRFSGRFDAHLMTRKATSFKVPLGGGRRECARRARQLQAA